MRTKIVSLLICVICVSWILAIHVKADAFVNRLRMSVQACRGLTASQKPAEYLRAGKGISSSMAGKMRHSSIDASFLLSSSLLAKKLYDELVEGAFCLLDAQIERKESPQNCSAILLGHRAVLEVFPPLPQPWVSAKFV